MNQEGREDRSYWSRDLPPENCEDCDAELREDVDGNVCDWCTTEEDE